MGRREGKWNDRNENENEAQTSSLYLWDYDDFFLFLLLGTCFFSLFFLFLAICEVDDRPVDRLALGRKMMRGREGGREGMNVVTLEWKEKSINQSINQSFL